MKYMCLFLLFVATLAAEEAKIFTDPAEAATWQWLLERANATQHVERDAKGTLKWVGFYDEEKQKGDYYRGSLTLDDQGYVAKMTFNAAHFSNDDFKQIAAFKRLQQLTAWHNGWDKSVEDKSIFSGAGLIQLVSTPLSAFNIGGSFFNDEGMIAVNQLESLRELKVYHTRVTDTGVQALKGNPHITYLNLGPQHSQKISMACLDAVVSMPNLERLDLDEMLLAYDGGLEKLVALKKLKHLRCKKSFLPAEDLERLQKAMPDLKIEYEPADEKAVERMRRAEARKVR